MSFDLPSRTSRLVEVDALRGVAALAVVLFHYTTRFSELFPDHERASFSAAYGYLGVNLFFVISGFVIFMTLANTRRPMDFVVSRFSRLFPAYWAAIFLTFLVTHGLGLPGKLVSLESAFANVLMVHGMFRVPHVDGVYWTLEVELIFYAGMLCLYRLRVLDRIPLVLIALLLLRVANFLLEQRFGIGLPWLVFRLLILQYLPWFTLGIAVYLATHPQGIGTRRQVTQLAVSATLTLWVCEGIAIAAIAMLFASLVGLSAHGKLTWLKWPPCVALGVVSYPLYLLHENIGWALLLQLEPKMPTDFAIVLVLGVSLFLASLLSRWVERPAMFWIRGRYAKFGLQRA